ncbi:MAG: hypothetical protein ACLFWD_01025 [Anaerolineales bacterium]
MRLKRGLITGWLALIALPMAAVMFFLTMSQGLEGPGFPLDDAWIHQTYARNLAMEGTWSFQAGLPSAGSTSPMWTALNVPAYLLGIQAVTWVALLGLAMLVATGLIASLWLREGRRLASWQLGALGGSVALEWHLVWAGLSGMETLLAGLLALWFLWLLLRTGFSPFKLGLILGLGVWIRPDLLSLSVAAGWYWAVQRSLRSQMNWPLKFGMGAALLIIPYLLLQWSLSGNLWPSTFYAKQAEYAALRGTPWLARFGQQLLAPLPGPLALLVPGALYWAWRRFRAGMWQELAAALWPLIYMATFATRLPVTYQHGRYVMPIIPILTVLGMLGMIEIARRVHGSREGWVLSRAWVLSTVAIALIFLVLGAQAYSRDVAIIETEMVKTAKWIQDNTPEDALIGAHDIGALGYYGERRIVDLAGLISPEVIPIIRQEAELAALLSEKSVDYIMTFPDWYPILVHDLPRIYSTQSVYSLAVGGTNMTVYRWPEQ